MTRPTGPQRPIILKWKSNPAKNTLTATYVDSEDSLFIAVVTLYADKWWWKLFEFSLEICHQKGEAETAYEAMQDATHSMEVHAE